MKRSVLRWMHRSIPRNGMIVRFTSMLHGNRSKAYPLPTNTIMIRNAWTETLLPSKAKAFIGAICFPSTIILPPGMVRVMKRSGWMMIRFRPISEPVRKTITIAHGRRSCLSRPRLAVLLVRIRKVRQVITLSSGPITSMRFLSRKVSGSIWKC